jgi:hypothetical protein
MHESFQKVEKSIESHASQGLSVDTTFCGILLCLFIVVDMIILMHWEVFEGEQCRSPVARDAAGFKCTPIDQSKQN